MKKLASLEERERRAAMALCDIRLEMDKFREADPTGSKEAWLKERDQHCLKILEREAIQPGQVKRIATLADVMYDVVKTLDPFSSEDRARILAELRREFIEKGDKSEQVRDRMKQVQAMYQGKYDTLKDQIDVLNLRKGPPKYVRQLRFAVETQGSISSWLGTDKHKDLAAGITPETTVERFVVEAIAEFVSHGAWEPVRDHQSGRSEFYREFLPLTAGTLDWTRAGCPVFSLTDDFFHALAVTDFGTSEDDKEDVLHMPFPAFVVNFPENKLLGARRMFVYRVAEAVASEKTEPEVDLVDGEQIVHGQMTVIWPNTRVALAREATAYSEWPAGVTRWDFFHGRAAAPKSTPSEALEALDMARRILANMLSYIEANHGLPQEKHRHGAAAAPVEREHKEPRFRIGRTVKLAPNIRRALRDGTSGQSWKLGHRFIVRGHWRSQAYGPKRSLRVRRWIEPFWKGPASLDEAFERTYSVE